MTYKFAMDTATALLLTCCPRVSYHTCSRNIFDGGNTSVFIDTNHIYQQSLCPDHLRCGQFDSRRYLRSREPIHSSFFSSIACFVLVVLMRKRLLSVRGTASTPDGAALRKIAGVA